ncbi:MAG: GNAT family N-acetyltransferase [Candidatus Dormiibacterota bacterium]
MSDPGALFQVFPVMPSDWAEYKEIRLRALADAPSAFGSSWAVERERPDEAWRERAGATPKRQIWSARSREGWVGLVGALREDDGKVQLVSMWVDPSWRRRGVARALIAVVVAWFGTAPNTGLYLWVSSDNEAARRCYQTEGFQLSGARSPLPSDPRRSRVEMHLVGPS